MYNLDLDSWLAHCDSAQIDPSAPTLEAAISFREAIERDKAPQTVRRTLSALSSMYAYAIEAEPHNPRATCNPFRTRSLPRPPASAYGHTEALSTEDALKVIAEVEKDPSQLARRDLAILRLLYDTGMRVSSAVALLRQNLFVRDGQMYVRVTVKGGKVREAPIPETATRAIEHWLSTSGHTARCVFPRPDGLGPLTTKSVNKRLEMYGKRAGVARVHPHRFRASYITAALDAGIPLHEVQASVHHEDPKTTLRYDRGKRGAGVADAVAKFRETRSKT